MKNNILKSCSLAVLLFLCSFLNAQEQEQGQEHEQEAIIVNGNIQTDILFPKEDKDIGAGASDEKTLSNTYLDLNLLSKYVNAGVRFEYLRSPLPGFEPDFAGQGVPYMYITGNYKVIKLTAGDFYDQFGSGFIFRVYKEKSLGIDNAIRGGRLVVEPVKGVNIKAIGGQQRRYFELNPGYLVGGDMELNFDQWLSKMQENNTFFMLGGSFISKHEDDEDIYTSDGLYKLKLPEDVAAFDVRARLQTGNYSFLLEHATKFNDPSYDNNYIYKNGTAWLLSSSYSQRGMSILLQAKRSDNMNFRSKRKDNSVAASFVNHLPAFTVQQTYALASLYPYATQPGGEWAFQGVFTYAFKRNTAIGGKYGTNIKFNASHIRSIDKTYVDVYDPNDETKNDPLLLKGTEGYTSSFFKLGDETYYQDIDITIDKKLTKDFKLSLMYMNLLSNEWVIRKHSDTLRANIFIGEGKYQITEKTTIRSELQYLKTKQDEGDWITGVLEVSFLPYFMFTISDMYNVGGTEKETKLHFYKALITFAQGSHLFQLGYGRSRAGFDCSGGVCRIVPASKGVQISYKYNF